MSEDFKDAYLYMMQAIIGDNAELKMFMDDLPIPEDIAMAESADEAPILPDEDGENEEDMYLTRIGYLKEEKKPSTALTEVFERWDNLWYPDAVEIWRQRTLNGQYRDDQEELLRVYEHLMQIIHERTHLIVDARLITHILNSFRDDGCIDRFSIDEDDFSQRTRIIIDKGQHRQSFFISSQEIWAINRGNGNR